MDCTLSGVGSKFLSRLTTFAAWSLSLCKLWEIGTSSPLSSSGLMSSALRLIGSGIPADRAQNPAKLHASPGTACFSTLHGACVSILDVMNDLNTYL